MLSEMWPAVSRASYGESLRDSVLQVWNLFPTQTIHPLLKQD